MMIPVSTASKALLVALSAPVIFAEPTQGSLDLARQLKEGVSTRDDAIKLLGKPICENRVNGCILCTWADERRAISLHFSQEGVLTDRHDWRK